MAKNKKQKKPEVGAGVVLVELATNYGYEVKRQICGDLDAAKGVVEKFVKSKAANSGKIRRFNIDGGEFGPTITFGPAQQTIFSWKEIKELG